MPRVLEIVVQPTGKETHHVTSVTLEERKYTFDFYTNAVDGSWNFDIRNADESAAVRGVAMSVGVNLLFPYRALDLPPGSLFVFDKDLGGADPSVDDFAEGRASLFYLESV